MRFLSILILSSLLALSVIAQTENKAPKSNFNFELNEDKEKINNLQTLGLIWFFLKYYHPNVTSGNYNWDYELFKITPLASESRNFTKPSESCIFEFDKKLFKYGTLQAKQ